MKMNMLGFAIPIRAIIAFLMFGGTVISNVLRININIAIITMTENNEVLCVNETNKDR